MRRLPILTFFILFICGHVVSQVSNYTFSQSTGTYTPITGGTVAASGSGLDDVIVSVTLPTAFTFNGNSITTVGFSPNGYLIMGNTTSHGYIPISSTATSNGIIAALAMDLVANASTTELRWEQIGNEIIFQWKDFRRISTTPENVNFQIRINTSNGHIVIVYDGSTNINTSTSRIPQVGLRGTANSDYNARRLTTSVPDSSPSWDDTGVATSNAHNVRFTSTSPAAFPSAGLTFTWSPPNPCSGTPEAGTITNALVRPTCTGSAPSPTTITTSGITPGVTGLAFQWEESIDAGGNWSNATGGSGATTVTYTPPVYAGTPILYRLKVTCTNSGLFDVSDVVVSVTNPSSPSTQASNVTTSTLSNTSATITWTNGNGGRRYVVMNTVNSFTDPVGTGDVTVGGTIYSGGEQIVYDGTGASVSVTGLTANTTYYVRVYEYLRCTGTPNTNYYNVATASNNPGNFTTLVYCIPTYSSGCSGDDMTSITLGTLSSTGLTCAPPIYQDLSGTQNAVPDLQRSSSNNVVITFATPGSSQFSRVWIDFDQNNVFDASESFSLGTSGSSNPVTIPITVPGGAVLGNTKMRVRGGDDSAISNTQACGASNSSWGMARDYTVNITPAPTCLVPLAINITNITNNSSTINWTEPAPPAGVGYEWEVRTSGAAGSGPTGLAASGSVATGMTMANVSSLTANTIYMAYVRSHCGVGDYSNWSSGVSFTTACDAANVPYIQNFESATVPNLPECTSRQNAGTGNQWVIVNNPGNGFTTKCLQYGFNSSNPANAWFYTQGLNLTGGVTYRLTFNYGNNSTSYVEKLRVSFGAAPANGSMTTQLLDFPNINQGALQNATVDFTPSSSGVYYIGFNCYSDADEWNLYTDNILLDFAPMDAVDWGNLQWPPNGTIFPQNTYVSYGRAYEPGVTDMAGQGAGLNAWVGWSSTNTDPSTWPTSNWVSAPFNVDVGNNDEFEGTFDPNTFLPGTYYYTYRYQLNGGPYTYGGYSIGGGGFWDGSNYVSGVLTVNACPSITPSATPSMICFGESSTLNVTSANNDYTYEWNPGMLNGAMQVVIPVASTLYTVTATDIMTGCTVTANSMVTVNPLPSSISIDPATVVIPCNGSAVQLIANGGIVTGIVNLSSGSLNLVIPDNSSTGVSNSQAVSGIPSGATIDSFIVTVNVSHLYVSDVEINLEAPNGEIVNLVADRGGSGDNFTNSRISSDNTKPSFTTGTPPFSATFRADLTSQTTLIGVPSVTTTSFSDLFDSPNGNWVIRAYDDDIFIEGTLINWSIKIAYTVPSNITWAPITGLFTDPAATDPYTGGDSQSVYALPTITTIYTATATSISGCSSNATRQVERQSCDVFLNLTTFIEGYMNGGAMRPVLLNSGISGATASQCDTITVSLHNGTMPYAKAYEFKGVLGVDGTINCSFPAGANGNSYYIVVTHRNALETWSAMPQMMTGSNTYNFSTNAGQSYGDNMVQVGGNWCMYSGDIDGNGEVSSGDFTIWRNSSALGEEGYRVSDLDGNGEVSSGDFTIWRNSSVNGVELMKP